MAGSLSAVQSVKIASAAALAAHPFLKGIPWRCLEALAPLASWVAFPLESMMIQEGEPANALFLLTRGRVALISRGATRAEVLETVEAGESLGWSWFVPPHVWQFSARVVEPVEGWRIAGPELRRLSHGDAEISGVLAERLVGVIAGRLQACRARLAESRKVAEGRPIRVEVVRPGASIGDVPPA